MDNGPRTMTRSSIRPMYKEVKGITITFTKEEGKGHDEVPSSVYVGVSRPVNLDINDLTKLISYLNMAKGLLIMVKNQGD